MRLVLMGPPGAGKGTQGMRLARTFSVPHIATGDLLRKIIATETGPLAQAAKVINEGKMVSDATASEIVFRELEGQFGFVLDGFPRNVVQAELLRGYLEERSDALTAAIYLSATEEEVLPRLTGRLTCVNCGETFHVHNEPPKVAGICDRCGRLLEVRPDDHPDRIRTRFRLYTERTRPLIGYYDEAGLLKTVRAMGTEDEVFARCVDTITP